MEANVYYAHSPILEQVAPEMPHNRLMSAYRETYAKPSPFKNDDLESRRSARRSMITMGSFA